MTGILLYISNVHNLQCGNTEAHCIGTSAERFRQKVTTKCLKPIGLILILSYPQYRTYRSRFCGTGTSITSVAVEFDIIWVGCSIVSDGVTPHHEVGSIRPALWIPGSCRCLCLYHRRVVRTPRGKHAQRY